MSEKKYSKDAETARSYYNSKDADNFYYHVWGGEDLHLGIYISKDDDIFTASRRTVREMANLASIDEKSRIIDLGGGFGGSARYLAATYGCHVTVLNISETENERGRKMNREQGLDDLIDIVDGNFEDIPFGENSFDIVWSQDAILHSSNRKKVITESVRVLRPGGDMIFTDPMQTGDCDEHELEPIYERINLSSLGSPEYYDKVCRECGLEKISFTDLQEHLVKHYSMVLEKTREKEKELKRDVSEEYLSNMKKGLKHWVEGGEKGNLTWGVFHYKNPS